MTVYTEQLYLGVVPTTWTALYTNSSGATIVRDIEVQNGGAATTNIYITIQNASGTQSATIVNQPTIGAHTSVQWSGRVRLNTGDQLWGNAGAGSCNAVITGYVFST